MTAEPVGCKDTWMPARDSHHQVVVEALQKDGWTITHDPLRLFWQGKALFVDLGAETIIAADKATVKIAVEIKTFVNRDAVAEIHPAAGQYVFYRSLLSRIQPERMLYLAIPLDAFHSLFAEGCVGEVLLEDEQISVIVFDPIEREVVRWKEPENSMRRLSGNS